MNRRHIIYLPSFSEYVHRTLKEATIDQRKSLPITEQKLFASDTAMKDFAHSQPLDRLLMLITKFGIQFDLRIYPDAEIADQVEFNSISQYQFPELRAEIIEAEVREKIHYLTSRETQLAAHMCAQNTHTPIYAISANSKDAIKRVRHLKSKQMGHSEQTHAATEAWGDLNRLLLNQMNAIEWALATLGLEQNDLRVLCALFQKREGAMTMKDVVAAVMMENKPKVVERVIVDLVERHLLASDKDIAPRPQVKKGKASPKTWYYFITDKGIGKVMEYLNYVYSITFKGN